MFAYSNLFAIRTGTFSSFAHPRHYIIRIHFWWIRCYRFPILDSSFSHQGFTTREINKKLCIWLIPVEWHWLHCPRHSLLLMAGGCQKLIPLCQRREKRPQCWWMVKKVIFFYINLSFVCTWQDANVELSFRRPNYCSSASARRITLFRLTGFDDDGGGVE